MIEARNVFPLKALNAITIRDTADKVRIAEKIIEANDKAQGRSGRRRRAAADRSRQAARHRRCRATALGGTPSAPLRSTNDGKPVTSLTIDAPSAVSAAGTWTSSRSRRRPTSLIKNIGNTEPLANPELRISEGEKATLHIGQRIPVPVTTFVHSACTGSGTSGRVLPPRRTSTRTSASRSPWSRASITTAR